jgi:hypothetical protein
MRNLLVLTLLLTVTLATAGPKPLRRKARVQAITQLCGTVRELTGNHMPGPGAARTGAGGKPVVRTVLVYPVMSLDSVEQDTGGFFTNVTAKPVATATSDKAGKFCVRLPAGQYSVLVREPKGLYANLFDTKNRINAVVITTGKTTTLPIVISHGASF